MKAGYLSRYFAKVAIKNLSAVEIDIYSSNQHEFNGVAGLKDIFGYPQGKVKYDTKFMYMNDYDDPVTEDGFLTWYDARENHPARTEYRLYFSTTKVTACAATGDLLLIGLRPDNSVLVIIADGKSTIANQIKWLFGFSSDILPGFFIRGELESEQDKIAFISRIILEQLGIAVLDSEETYLEDMVAKFGNDFPSTDIFSRYARSTLKDVEPLENADNALLMWIEREEILFRTFEKHLVANRLYKGFADNVDGFLSFSLSVQNRRKSRVGYALENHLEEIFKVFKIRYSRNRITENNSKPDFIFPDIEKYHDENFDSVFLTMLGVKSTCKDRWRQVLSEADRIKEKHLFTLESAISTNQTNEMKTRNLQLVVPAGLHCTYDSAQRAWLMSLSDFIKSVDSRQKKRTFT